MKSELTDYLAAHIPLSTAMQVTVEEAGAGRVKLRIPLAPNINHRGTIFGGSAAGLAMLTGWGMVWTLLRLRGKPAAIVIRRNTMEFDRLMPGAVEAVCDAPSAAEIDRFFEELSARGKARLALAVTILAEGIPAARFSGEFAAVSEKGSVK